LSTTRLDPPRVPSYTSPNDPLPIFFPRATSASLISPAFPPTSRDASSRAPKKARVVDVVDRVRVITGTTLDEGAPSPPRAPSVADVVVVTVVVTAIVAVIVASTDFESSSGERTTRLIAHGEKARESKLYEISADG
jgi:hypothetical protein